MESGDSTATSQEKGTQIPEKKNVQERQEAVEQTSDDDNSQQNQDSSNPSYRILYGLLIVLIVLIAVNIWNCIGCCLDVKELLKERKDLENDNRVYREKMSICETRNNNLELRLSKMIWTNAKPDALEFTKLEDNSPIKIAESFRETYDNEYTLAMEEIGGQKPTEMLLKVLKVSYELCTTYSSRHLDAIKNSTASIQVQLPRVNEAGKFSKDSPIVTLDKPFSASDWSQIVEIRISAAQKLQTPIIEALLDIIVKDMDINLSKQPNMIAYAKKCLELCWMMTLHPKPVYIKFVDITERTLFDTDLFRPYLRDGKYFDFIVWPPLFTHEGGRMLSKGIAEGKN